jgi:hypothetical protein
VTRLGLIARADNRGLGIQTWEAFRHLKPAKTMVVDCPSQKPLALHLDRFPGATVVRGFPTARDFREFLRDLDVVFTCETPYSYDLFRVADDMAVRTVLQYNFEFLDYLRSPELPRPTLFAAPSPWRYGDVPFQNKTHLPVPIATDRFTQAPSGRHRAVNFLHVVGRPAIHDRNGTADLLSALAHVCSPITVTITCQDKDYVRDLAARVTIPANVNLVLNGGDRANYWDNYVDQDVLLMPRRFGGLCLPAQEAIGAGMPVIMPDIEPNTWLPDSWLVPASYADTFIARTEIDVYSVHRKALAMAIDRFATDEAFFAQARATAAEIAHHCSWESQRPVYDATFANLTTRKDPAHA